MPKQTEKSKPVPIERFNPMHPIRWVLPEASTLLDVGCNVGAFLRHCHELRPDLRLAGVEINAKALETARRLVPDDVALHCRGAEELPFDDESFDVVTCIEVFEHVPEALREMALREMRRVLRPGGRLVLRTPHAGLFAFLDPANLRFRVPWLYRRVIGRGLRDSTYESRGSEVVWHHHFTRRELLDLAGGGWTVETWRRGGLFLVPLADMACWPFYRAGRTDHPICRSLMRISSFDLGCNYGPLAFDVLMVLRRA